MERSAHESGSEQFYFKGVKCTFSILTILDL